MTRAMRTGADTILIAGGGTGGHVFPAIAVADALRQIAMLDVVFVGTPKGLEGRLVPARGYRLELLPVVPMTGGGAARAVVGAVVAARETARAPGLVRRIRPKAVLSVGGYAAGPVSLAARMLGVPVAVFEPNSVVGLTNKLLAPMACRAYLAWTEAASAFKPQTVRHVGVPLRPGFSPKPYAPRGTARVFVIGGSQGAAPLNERMPAAMARLARDVPGLEVVHQAGRDRDAAVRDAYEREGFTNVTVVPFLDDVAKEIALADLVIARAGAGTIAEIAAVGRASILVPFPHAAGDHQAKNAAALAGAGGALAIRQEAADATRIAIDAKRLLSDSAARVAMADAARSFGRPAAAIAIAHDLLEIAGIPAGRAAASSPGGAAVNGRGAGGSNGLHYTNGAGSSHAMKDEAH